MSPAVKFISLQNVNTGEAIPIQFQAATAIQNMCNIDSRSSEIEEVIARGMHGT